MRASVLFMILLCIVSCTARDTNPNPNNLNSQAYVPVYSTATDVTQIAVQPVRTTQQAGKIYAYGSYLFQNDLQQGFHIVDNTDPRKPVKLLFLKVPFSTEISIKGNFLYTNNLNDLVVFDISNIRAPRLVKRMEGMFPAVNQQYPPFSNVSFQCPDPRKGIIVKWELQTTTSATCRR